MPGYHKTKSGKMAKKGLYYNINKRKKAGTSRTKKKSTITKKAYKTCLLYTSPSPRDGLLSRMPSSA